MWLTQKEEDSKGEGMLKALEWDNPTNYAINNILKWYFDSLMWLFSLSLLLCRVDILNIKFIHALTWVEVSEIED